MEAAARGARIFAMTGTLVRAAKASDAEALVAMRCLLWPESPDEEHKREIEAELNGEATSTLPKETLVSVDEDGELTGFLEVGLRSHADGCDSRQPVGYVEGWFVVEARRGRGLGAKLMRAAEDWARARGCREMASDALIDNGGSQQAHAALGFEVVDRCVTFRKAL